MSPVNGRHLNTLWPRVGRLEVLKLRGTTRPPALLKREPRPLIFFIHFYFVLTFKPRKLSKGPTTGPKQPVCYTEGEAEVWGPE